MPLYTMKVDESGRKWLTLPFILRMFVPEVLLNSGERCCLLLENMNANWMLKVD